MANTIAGGIYNLITNISGRKAENKYNQNLLDYQIDKDKRERYVENKKITADYMLKLNTAEREGRIDKRAANKSKTDLLEAMWKQSNDRYIAINTQWNKTKDADSRKRYVDEMKELELEMDDFHNRLEGGNVQGNVQGNIKPNGQDGQNIIKPPNTIQDDQSSSLRQNGGQNTNTLSSKPPINNTSTNPSSNVSNSIVSQKPQNNIYDYSSGYDYGIGGKVGKTKPYENLNTKTNRISEITPVEGKKQIDPRYKEKYIIPVGGKSKELELYNLYNEQSGGNKTYEDYLNMKATAGGYKATKPLADDYAVNKMAGMEFKNEADKQNTYAKFLSEYKRLDLKGFADRELIKSYNKIMPDMHVKAQLSYDNITIFDKMIELINTGNVTGKGGQIKKGLAGWAELFNTDPKSLVKYSQAQLFDRLVRVAVAPMRLQLVGGGQIVMGEHDIMKEVMGGKGANKSTALYLVKYFRQLSLNSVNRYNFKASRANEIPGKTASYYPLIDYEKAKIKSNAKTRVINKQISQPSKQLTEEQIVNQWIDSR